MAGFKEGALELKKRNSLAPSDIGHMKLLVNTNGDLYTVNETGVSALIQGGGSSDHKVLASPVDTVPGTLVEKLIGSDNIFITAVGATSATTLEFGTYGKIAVSDPVNDVGDIQATLEHKLVAGSGTLFEIVTDPTYGKQIKISLDGSGSGDIDWVSIINKPSASPTTSGVLTSADFNTFNNKQDEITTGTSAQYFKGDLTLGTFPTDLSSFSNGPQYVTSADLSIHDSELLSDHNAFGNKQGVGPEYYHLSNAQYQGLTSAGDTSLHTHSYDRNRANHVGTQTASTISDFTTTVRTSVTATTPIVYTSATGAFSHSTTGTAGTYVKVVTNSFGHVTSGGPMTSADIPNLPWTKITSGKPTTLTGYGISSADTLFDSKYSTALHDHNGLYLTSTSALNPANISQDSNFRLVNDLEKAFWNGKVNYTDLSAYAPAVHNHDGVYLGLHATADKASNVVITENSSANSNYPVLWNGTPAIGDVFITQSKLYFNPVTGNFNSVSMSENGVALSSKYSLSDHNHNGTYQPTGDYSLNGHTHYQITNSRVGVAIYNNDDALGMAAKNALGTSFFRMFNSPSAPRTSQYYATINMPETTIGNFTQYCIAFNGSEFFFGGGAGNSDSVGWKRVWMQDDFSGVDIAHWNTGYSHSQTTGNPHGTTYSQVGAAAASHGHNQIEIESTTGWISTAFASKSNTDHNHNGTYQPVGDYSLNGHIHSILNVTDRQTQWLDANYDVGTAKLLRWKNYVGHTIFDASQGTAPDGSAHNNSNSEIAWSATYPTLMGWNGTNTYGVRVDSSKNADYAGSVEWANVQNAPIQAKTYYGQSIATANCWTKFATLHITTLYGAAHSDIMFSLAGGDVSNYSISGRVRVIVKQQQSMSNNPEYADLTLLECMSVDESNFKFICTVNNSGVKTFELWFRCQATYSNILWTPIFSSGNVEYSHMTMVTSIPSTALFTYPANKNNPRLFEGNSTFNNAMVGIRNNITSTNYGTGPLLELRNQENTQGWGFQIQSLQTGDNSNCLALFNLGSIGGAGQNWNWTASFAKINAGGVLNGGSKFDLGGASIGTLSVNSSYARFGYNSENSGFNPPTGTWGGFIQGSDGISMMAGTGLYFNVGATTVMSFNGVNISLNTRPTFAGNLAWDAGNFNPNDKANVVHDHNGTYFPLYPWLTDVATAWAEKNRLGSYNIDGMIHATAPTNSLNHAVISFGNVSRQTQIVSPYDQGGLYYRKYNGNTDQWVAQWSRILDTSSDSGSIANWNSKADGNHNHDSAYLGKTAKASDSDLLDGIDSSRFVYGTNGYATGDIGANFATINKSGFYNTNAATDSPVASTWAHVIHSNHSGDTNWAFQIAANFGTGTGNSEGYHVRTKTGGTYGAWRNIWTSLDFGASDITNWNTAYAQRHTHNNLTLLEQITPTLTANWNTAYTHSQTNGNPHGTTLAQIVGTPLFDVKSYLGNVADDWVWMGYTGIHTSSSRYAGFMASKFGDVIISARYGYYGNLNAENSDNITETIARWDISGMNVLKNLVVNGNVYGANLAIGNWNTAYAHSQASHDYLPRSRAIGGSDGYAFSYDETVNAGKLNLTLWDDNDGSEAFQILNNGGNFIAGFYSNRVSNFYAIQEDGVALSSKYAPYSHNHDFNSITNRTKDVGDITARIDSGWYNHQPTTTALGWPTNGSWWHLMSSTHENGSNYFAMQLAADFYNQDFRIRSTNGNGLTAWSKIWTSTDFNSTQIANWGTAYGFVDGISIRTGHNPAFASYRIGYKKLGTLNMGAGYDSTSGKIKIYYSYTGQGVATYSYVVNKYDGLCDTFLYHESSGNMSSDNVFAVVTNATKNAQVIEFWMQVWMQQAIVRYSFEDVVGNLTIESSNNLVDVGPSGTKIMPQLSNTYSAIGHTHNRLYRDDDASPYYLRHSWTMGQWYGNGWRITNNNDSGDSQTDIHTVAVNYADLANDSNNFGGQLPSYYTKTSDFNDIAGKVNASRIAVDCYQGDDPVTWMSRVASKGNHFGRYDNVNVPSMPRYFNYIMLREAGGTSPYSVIGRSSDGNWYIGASAYNAEMSSVYKLWTGENFDPASKSNTGHTHALSDIYNWGNYSAPTYEGIWPSGVTKGNGNFAVLWQKNNYDLYLNASNSINFQTTDGTTRTNKFIITPTFAEFFVSAKVNGDFTTTGAISANDVNAKVLRANMPVTGDGPGQGAHIALYDNAGGKGWLFQHGSTNDRLSFMHLDGGAAWNSKVYFTQNGDIAAQGAMIAGIWAAGTHVVGGGWSWSGHQTLNSVNWSGFMHNANGETLIGSTNNMSLRLAVNQADIATVTSTGMSVYNKVTAGNAGVGNWVYNTDGAFFGLASENKESWSGMLMVYGNQYLTSPNDIQLASKSTGGKARFLLETTSTAGINSSAAAFTGESSTMPTNAYNWGFCLRNDRQTVGLSIFMNGSTRSLDGGPDAVTIRNEEGKLILGHTLKPTEIFGSSFTYNGTTVSLNGHTHSYQPIGDYSLTGHTHNFLNNLGGANDTRNIDNAYTDGTSQFASYIISNATGTNPFNTQPGNNHCKVLEMSYTDAGNWHHQISLDFFTDSMAFRRRDTSVWQPWRTLWHSGNLTPVSLAANNTWTGINTYTNTIYYDGSMIRRFNGSNYGLGISESITFSYKYTINDSWETFMGYDISEFYLRSNNNPLNIVGAAVSIRNSDTNPTTLIEAKNDLSGPYINMSSPRISMTGQIQNLEIKNSQYSIITLTSPTTATTSYYNYNYVNISDNAGTLRLPSAPLNPGKWFAVFCRTDGAGVTFTSTSGGMVTNWDGSWKGSSYTPQNTSFRCFIFRSNGEDWFISM